MLLGMTATFQNYCSSFVQLCNGNPAYVSQIKQEKPSGDGCKSEPMDTAASSSVSSTVAADEDKKPEVKKEPKEEEEGSGSAGSHSSPASTQSKKKSEFC